jgi:hypothetical protein
VPVAVSEVGATEERLLRMLYDKPAMTKGPTSADHQLINGLICIAAERPAAPRGNWPSTDGVGAPDAKGRDPLEYVAAYMDFAFSWLLPLGPRLCLRHS